MSASEVSRNVTHIRNRYELAQNGFFIGQYESELDKIELLICYRHLKSNTERMAITVEIGRAENLVYSSTMPATSADDGGYVGFAFVISKDYVENSRLVYSSIKNEFDADNPVMSDAKIVSLPAIVAAAQSFHEAVSLLSCDQIATN